MRNFLETQMHRLKQLTYLATILSTTWAGSALAENEEEQLPTDSRIPVYTVYANAIELSRFKALEQIEISLNDTQYWKLNALKSFELLVQEISEVEEEPGTDDMTMEKTRQMTLEKAVANASQ